MRVKCPSCSSTFQVPDGAATGKKKCPRCGQKLDLSLMQRPEDLKRGDRLGGCRVEGLLGRGGMAVVYKATQLSLDRPVALKVLPKQLARNKQFVERFNREASALARLSHPNIVGILDKGVEGDTYYFVMEYVEGRSLRDMLRREGSLSPESTAELMNGICAALEYAHENHIVHRDLKPSNILLDAGGTPKLADFGIARIVGGATTISRELTMAHSSMGSADYMAPEQREDAATADHRADIYALGVVLYQMLTGHLPVGTFTPASKLVQELPAAIDRVVRKALASNPEQRFESVALFRAALAQALAKPHGHGTAHRAARGTSSRAAFVAIALGFLAAVAVVAALLIPRSRRPAVQQPQPNPPAKPPTSTAVERPKKPPKPPPKRPPTPPVKPPVKPPTKPPGESDTVKKALADVRSYIAQNPGDYKGQIARIENVILQHNDPAVVQAAKKEREAVIRTLTEEVDANLKQLQDQADALAAKAAYGAAIRIFGAYPANLRTKEATERLDAARKAIEDRARAAFARTKQRVDELVKARKATEAADLLELAKDYGLPDVAKEADELLDKLQDAVAAEATRTAAEQARVRASAGKRMKELWADRQYPEALAIAEALLTQSPNKAARRQAERYERAGKLMAGFWTAVRKGAQARKGRAFRINGAAWTLVELKHDSLVLADASGRAKVTRALKSLAPADLASLALATLSSKKADTHLMLGLLHTFDRKPSPALAKKAFERARACGASRRLCESLQAFGVERQPETEAPPKPQVPAGFVLDFNGTSDYVEVPDKRSLHLKAFTAEAWVWRRPGGEDEQHVVTKNLGFDRNESFAIFIRDGRWAYATGFGDEKDVRHTNKECPTGQWVHCALVFNGEERAFFVDGKLASKTRPRRMLSYDDKPLTIGCEIENNDLAFFWNGAIDEVRLSMFPRYRKDFAPERPLKADRRTVLLLHFDEGEGRTARDASGLKTKNHARIYGARFARPDELKRPPRPPPDDPPREKKK